MLNQGFLFLLGIEARGFIFGPAIALAIGAKFVPLRKPRKLPGTFSLYRYANCNLISVQNGPKIQFWSELAP